MLQSQSPFEWYFVRAKEDLQVKKDRLLNSYRWVNQYLMFLPTPLQITFGDFDSDHVVQEFKNRLEDLRVCYTLYEEYLDSWEFPCMIHPSIKRDIESFLINQL